MKEAHNIKIALPTDLILLVGTRTWISDIGRTQVIAGGQPAILDQLY